jgi:NAD+ synthase (glutamine-hydrolysing)
MKPTKPLKILASQSNFTVGAIENNAEKIKSIIQKYQSHNDLIVFPELALTGYPPEDLLFRKALHARIQKTLQDIAKITQNCHVIVGHPLLENGACFNAASIFYQGNCVKKYRKQKLPNYGVFDEMRYFMPGPIEPCLFKINNYQLALCICEDIWQTGPVEQALTTGAELLVCINASPYNYQKYIKRVNLLKNYAQLGLNIIYINLVGGQDDFVFDGQSLAFNKHGEVCARLPAFTEANATITYENNDLSGTIAKEPSQEEEIYQALVLATHDYVKKHSFPGVLLGLSGGIDSALTLAIAVDALGAKQVHALIMPSRFTAPISIADATEQANKMGVQYTNLSIEPAFAAMLNTLADPFKELPTDVTEENLQARIRGMLLMAMSNKTGKLVLTTSNKSESAVGYATLYGDMAGGFSVLKDVLKTEVYKLAQYRNSLSAVIPERVITRAPTAELAENQTDQDSLPPYPILDAIIKAYVEHNLDAEEIIAQGLEAHIVHKVIKLIKQNEYKRRQAAPGPRISPRSFSRDWRYPITSKY